MHDFWIGDWVRIISNGKSGQFEGEKNGKARVKINKKFYLFKFENIELIPEEELHEEVSILDSINYDDEKIKTSFKNQIDLHIEKLEPKMKNQKAEVILNFQLRKLKEFLETSIKNRMYTVLVIHGKGLGSLRVEIEHLLQNYTEVLHFYSVNEGGATEIFFNY